MFGPALVLGVSAGGVALGTAGEVPDALTGGAGAVEESELGVSATTGLAWSSVVTSPEQPMAQKPSAKTRVSREVLR